MTRTLVFDGPKAERRLDLLLMAVLSAGDGTGDRGPATIRKEARLLEAFDSVSVAAPTLADRDARALKVEPGVTQAATISQEDFDLLTQYAEKAKWTPRVAREAVDLWDWLSTVPIQP